MCVHRAQVSEEECRYYVKSAESIMVVPTASVTMRSMTSLRKALPPGTVADVIAAQTAITSIDGTPFVTLAPHIGPKSHLYIFAERGRDPDAVSEAFMRWTKSASRDQVP